MKPLSEPDAKEIFNTAVEVASELDDEAHGPNWVVRRSWWVAEAVTLRSRAGSGPQDQQRRCGRCDPAGGTRQLPLGAGRWPLWLDWMLPLALANAARWDDEAVASRWETIGTVLKTGLGEGTIRPEQAAALSMLADDSGAVIAEILKQVGHETHPSIPALVEEAAYDVLMRHSHHGCQTVAHFIKQHGSAGPWAESLLRRDQFVATLTPEPTTNEQCVPEPDAKADDLLSAHVWSRETLLDSSLLQEAVRGLLNRMSAERGHYRRSLIFESARKAVSPADRVVHIAALAGLDDSAVTVEAVEAVLQAVDQWSASPSVQAWCRTKLPEVIVARFPAIIRYLPFGEDHLTPALNRTGLDEAETQDLLLKGLERHAEGMGAELIFSLAGVTGCKLVQPDAASLVDWYAERLEKRISVEHRDQKAPDSKLPRDVDEAAARFLFAYMGDCDLRLRWRAAHAVRRLARIGDEATLMVLVAEYHRREERVFRARGFEFYWLAARLWFVLAWDRVAGERPESGARAGSTLLDIALDDSFPHMLIRSFARESCEKLAAAGHLSLTTDESRRLACVNETPVPRVPADPGVRKTIGRFGRGDDFAYDQSSRRFQFDTMDTLPYWYAPMLESFASVDGERFLREAERWIIDVWGYAGDIGSLVEGERRRGRFNDRNWYLSMNRQGSNPTLEPLRTHLEWHAMWCASGELLKTEPLALCDENDWNDLDVRIHQEKLVGTAFMVDRPAGFNAAVGPKLAT